MVIIESTIGSIDDFLDFFLLLLVIYPFAHMGYPWKHYLFSDFVMIHVIHWKLYSEGSIKVLKLTKGHFGIVSGNSSVKS